MKFAIRTLITLSALVASSAFAEGGDPTLNIFTNGAVQSKSTLTRAEVQTEAVKAAAEKRSRGYQEESGNYLIASNEDRAVSMVTREQVRAEAIKFASAGRTNESNS